MGCFFNVFRSNKLFCSLSLFFILCSGVFLIFFKKADGFVLLNSFHTSILTRFFRNVSALGDGTSVLLLALVLFVCFKKYRRLALLLVIAYCLSGIFSQLLKNLITAPRPLVYFKELGYSLNIDTFKNCGIGYSSFPSGHTTSAFTLATVLSFYLRNRYVTLFTFVAALLVGYSRIYLANHFLIDVLFGMIVGVFFGTLSMAFWNDAIVFLSKVFKRKEVLQSSWSHSISDSSTSRL